MSFSGLWPLATLILHCCFLQLTPPASLSEYGCLKNGRDFNEIEALMSDEMTSVYSGGLMYEYTYEENKFGIVKVDGSDSKVEKLDGFAKFSSALSKYPMATGSGGAASSTHSVACPTKDSIWEVDPSEVPLMPTQAQKYMDDGAGDGPGFVGGSQADTDSGTSPSNGDSNESTSGDNGSGDDSAGVRLGESLWVVSAAVLASVLAGTLAL